MIRFLGNKYTREQIIVLRKVIGTAREDILCSGGRCAVTCDKCHLYRPCRDLANLLKHMDELLAITEK